MKRSPKMYIIIVVIVSLFVSLLSGFFLNFHMSGSTATSTPSLTNSTSSTLPGIQTSLLPWPKEVDHLKERLSAIGLPALAEEGTVLHTHQHIDIYIQGNHTDIPYGIGINDVAGFISPIHVHDEANIIHVESPTVQTFTLGQFFDVWGVRFTDVCIGGYCNDIESKLKVFINGKEIKNNFRDVSLTAHEEIAVIYGKEKDMPSPIPSSFNFSNGL